MSDLDKAINATVNNQNEISDFAMVTENPAAANSANSPTVETPPLAAVNKKRGRGRPKKAAAQIKQNLNSFVPEDILNIPATENADIGIEPDAQAVQRRNAAKGATLLIQTTGMMVGGEDAKMDKDEFCNVEENLDRYFEHKGISDFPPGISLALALGGYYFRVITTQKAQPKIFAFYSWIKSKMPFVKKQAAQQPKEKDGA